MAGALQDRGVLLTGCVANIGRAAAMLFAAEGARLCLADIDAAGATTARDAAALGAEAHFEAADVSNGADMQRLIESAHRRLGRLDVVVSNAGIQRAGGVTEFAEEDWDALMAVNPRSCFLAAKHAVPLMRDAGGGVIVHMASLAGLHGGPGLTGYSASKGAIVAFTKALAAEVAPAGIRVNALCPGWVDTAFNQPAIDHIGGPDSLSRAIQASVPLGRQAQPREIAAALLFLASDASSYMTGQALAVDGGVY